MNMKDERERLEREMKELEVKEERIREMCAFRNADCEEHDWAEGEVTSWGTKSNPPISIYACVEIELEMQKTEGGETVQRGGEVKSVTRFCAVCGREETYTFETKLMGEPVMSDPYADIREYQFDEDDEE